MSYSGFTATVLADNGVIRVTDTQELIEAIVTGECVVITDNGGRLRGAVLARRTQFLIGADVNSGDNASSAIGPGHRTVTALRVRILDNSHILSRDRGGVRVNVQLSELVDSSITQEAGNSLFVYSLTDAILSNCDFRGIAYHEVYRLPTIYANIRYISSLGPFNYEVGRLDMYGVSVITPVISNQQFLVFMQNAGTGNNSMVFWNSPSVDVANGSLYTYADGGYDKAVFAGSTASYNLLNLVTSAAILDVLAIYRDDRDSIGGALVERARYTTNTNGRFTGTVDSKTLATGANSERPTLFVLRKQSRLTGGTYPTNPVIGGNAFNYVIDVITSSLEVRSYEHLKPGSTALSLDTQVGKIAADLSVSEYAAYNLTQDTFVTLTYAAALALTTIATLDQLYDRVKAQWRLVDGFTYPSSSGSSLLIDVPIVVDGTAVSVCSFSAGILTVKAGVLAIGTKFTKLVTTGTITFVNGAAPSATIVYQSSAGTSVPVTAPNLLTGSRVQIYNVTSSTQMDNVTISTGGYAGRFNWSTDITIRLRAGYCVGTSARLVVEDTTVLTNTGASFLNSQVNDTIYNAAAINGSTVTEFAADYPNVQIDVTDPDGVTTVPRIYAWYVNNLTTASGIASFFGGMVADDAVNFVIKTAIVNLKLDNRNLAPCIIAGGRLYTDTNATVIAALSNSIQMDPNRVYVAETGVSGLTAAESALLANITPIKAKTDNLPSDPAGVSTVNAVAASVWATPIDGTYTASDIQRITAAIMAGKSSGHPTTPVFRNLADNLNRVTGTVDASGNRTAITVTP